MMPAMWMSTLLLLLVPWALAGSYQGSLSRKQKVVALLKSLQTGDPAPLAYINPKKYIQHNLSVGDGIAGIQALIASLNGTGTVDTVRVFQDGDYVWTHSIYNIFGAYIGYDVFRFENGLIVEHWDNLQPQPAGPNPSGHTMTDGPTMATDFDKTDANRALLQQYASLVLIGGNVSSLPSYYNGNNYIQHNPLLGDGLTGLAAGLAQLTAQGLAVKYTSLKQVHAEGNFVLVMSEGLFGTQVTAYYDMMRVENGKIAEHWDALQAIPPQSQWKNSNGKW